MTEIDEQIRKKQLPCILSMGHIDLIFQLEFDEKDLQKPLSNSSNLNNINDGGEDISYYNFGDINSIKDLYFLKKKRSIWNKINLKAGNKTLSQILTGNEQLKTKCIVDYIGYGPLRFENDESFFKDIFNYVTLKNFLIINEKFLDKNSPSSFSIELTYQGNTKTIKYEPPPPEEEDEKEESEKKNVNETINLRQSQNKPNLKRSESILNNLIPSLKRYELIFINYTDIEQIPGDFSLEDLCDLLSFFKSNGSIIFINFFNPQEINEEVGGEGEEGEEGEVNKFEENNEEKEEFLRTIKEKNILYDLTQIFFYETYQAQKMFQKHYNYLKNENSEESEQISGNKIFQYFSKNMLTGVRAKIDETKTGLFMDNLETFIVNSLIKNKVYKKSYKCDILPKIENNENKENEEGKEENNEENENDEENEEHNEENENDEENEKDEEEQKKEELYNETKEIMESNKAELYSIFISVFIHTFAYNIKKFHLFKLIDPAFEKAMSLMKERIEYIRKNKKQEENILNKEEAKIEKEELKNIIYLIDTTLSMRRYEYLIESIAELNQEIVNNYGKVKIGYVFYRDFESETSENKDQDLNDNVINNDNDNNDKNITQSDIKVINPSSQLINIIENENYNFESGGDFAEDWASPLNAVSQLKLGKTGNIVIHICDSGAHGQRFSEYCNRNEFENSLIQALKKCSENKIKIIGTKINDYTRKSFLECQKIYKEFNGRYLIADLTSLTKSRDSFNKEDFINKMQEYIGSALIKVDLNSENNDEEEENENLLNEEDFTFKGYTVKMRSLSEIEKYQGKEFSLLPKDGEDNLDKEKNKSIQGIKQGAIGDCYLISSILSMVSKFPLIFNYIFPNTNYDQNSDIIEMYVYKNGIKELISFKNTYATTDEKNLLFAKPINNELYGISLEKGYAISKAENSLQSGYVNIVGGSGYQVFETILGTSSEKYKSKHEYFKNRLYSYKYIDDEKLKEKIKKYIDWGGVITFGVFYYKGSAHEYSLQGYKIDKKNEMFLEIINPHRSGEYCDENIFVQEDYNKMTQEQKDQYNNRETPKISENDFTSQESKSSLKSYPTTGFLIIKYEVFLNWYGSIDICDPMFGSNDYTITFVPDGSKEYFIEFELEKPTKFKVSLKDLNAWKFEYKIELFNDKNEFIINEDDCDIIYELLKEGKYFIKIISKTENEINNTIYVKLQSYEKLQIKVEQKNNNVLITENDNSFKDVYNQMKYMNEIFRHLQICNHNLNLELYSKAGDSNIYHRKKEFEEVNGVITFPNFYLDYQNTESGYSLNIINKYKFENENNIVYTKVGKDLMCSTKHGKYKITEDLIMTGFDTEFKNYLLSKGFERDEIDLKTYNTMIEREEKSSSCCLIF